MKKLSVIAALAALAAAPAFGEGDPAKGEKLFKKCKSCHMIVNGDEVIFKGGKTGPNLYGVIGRQAGSYEGFKYGKGLAELGEKGMVWDEALLAEYITDPKGFLKAHEVAPKTKMTFKLKKGAEDVAAYLASVGPKAE